MLEFGAGLGSLSLALAETGARVVAVELDRHLLPVLRTVVEPAGVEVIEGDAMTLDVAGLLAERGGGSWSLVANLPYNLATPLVLRTLVEVPAIERLLVMVQREVGERMAATVGDPAYGSVSVRVAYFARSSVAGKVPASVFIPRPRVESVLVRMERRAQPAVPVDEVSYERLAAVVKAGFGQRRKDVAELAGRRRRPRGLRPGRHPPRGAGRGAHRRGVGKVGPMTRLFAPAKLTLSLAVTGVRPDGYHQLRSEMVSLSLADELTFTEGGTGLTFVAEPGTRTEALGDEADNLITRALGAVGRRAAVHVRKRIPLGGGLGGGSTDAAAVLRWAGCTDPDVARALGSDVPFSVVGGRALVEGTGEDVTPLDFEPRTFLLVLPPFGVDTAKVYAAWDEQGRTAAPESRGQRADHGGAGGRAETGPVA